MYSEVNFTTLPLLLVQYRLLLSNFYYRIRDFSLCLVLVVGNVWFVKLNLFCCKIRFSLYVFSAV